MSAAVSVRAVEEARAQPTLDPREVRLAESIERAAWSDQFAAAPRDLARTLGLATETIDDATLLLAPRLPLTLFNRVLCLGLDHPASHAQIATIEARYRAAGVARYWVQTTPLEPGQRTAERLLEHGFARPPRGHWAKMLRGVEPVTSAQTELVVRAAAAGEVGPLARVIALAHGMPPLLAPWVETLGARERWTMFGVWDGENPVAAGLVFVDGTACWLGLAGTLPAHRRRGAQGLLMRARIAHAASSGATLAATETGEPIAGEHNPSLANMLRVGFRKVHSRANHERLLA